MQLPKPVGPISEATTTLLRTGRAPSVALPSDAALADPLRSADLQLALWCCHEMSCRGFAGVDLDEFDPAFVALRSRLSDAMTTALRAAVEPFGGDADDMAAAVAAAAWDVSSLPVWLADHGDRDHARDWVAMRAPGELRPSDPAVLAIPRINGEAKSAVLSITFDERGDGSARVERAARFTDLVASLQVRTPVEALPAEALAVVNLPWMLGLARSTRHAACGALATRVLAGATASPRIAAWADRTGLDPAWFELRATGDVAHRGTVVDRLLPAIAEEPGEVVFGARALALLECRLATRAVGAWHAERPLLHDRRTSRPVAA